MTVNQINPYTSSIMPFGNKSANISSDSEKKTSFLDTFKELKEEMREKIENGEKEESFDIGAQSFTLKEWDTFIQKFDKAEETIQREIKEEIQNRLEQKTVAKQKYPYAYLAQDGVIEYNGVTIICDERTNSLQLGDCSDMSDCIRVNLENGGSFIFNKDQIDNVSKVISMFSPEDQRRILCALADEKKIQATRKEIEDETNSLGEESTKDASEEEKQEEEA